MSEKAPITHPKLVHYARYRWDKIREQHQLVYPEGVMELNEPGAEIVKHCDGRSIDDLVRELTQKFNGADVDADVREFVNTLARKGLIKNVK